MKCYLLVFCIFFCSLLFVNAQNTKVLPGKIEIIKDQRVDVLINKHVSFYQNLKGYHGFRIQIFFDSGNNSKGKALSVKSEFTKKFSDTEAYLLFQEPNYKIRVGDFRNRIDAHRFLHNIIEDFPNAFIVVDEIQTPPVNQDFGEED